MQQRTLTQADRGSLPHYRLTDPEVVGFRNERIVPSSLENVPETQTYVDRADNKQTVTNRQYDTPLETVRVAYSDATGDSRDRALIAHTDWMSTDTKLVEDIFGIMPEYNGFDPEVIEPALADIDGYVSMGREGSPVMYMATDQPRHAEILLTEELKFDAFERRPFLPTPDEIGSFDQPSEYPKQRVSDGTDTPDSETAMLRVWWD